MFIFRLLRASFYRLMQSLWSQGSTLEVTNLLKLSGKYFTLFVLNYLHLTLLNVYLYVLLSVNLHLKSIVLLWWACIPVTWLKEGLAVERAPSSLFIQALQLGNGFITFVITISSTHVIWWCMMSLLICFPQDWCYPGWGNHSTRAPAIKIVQYVVSSIHLCGFFTDGFTLFYQLRVSLQERQGNMIWLSKTRIFNFLNHYINMI